MSHRTNYAMREGGRVRFSASRYGATGIPDVLFDRAPNVAAYLREMDPVAPEELYDRVWCEGLLLLDLDARVALFDGVSELMFEGAMRRVWAPLLETVWGWDGWRLFYTPDPVRHLGLHLGLPASWATAKGVEKPRGPTEERALLTYYPAYTEDYQTEVQWREKGGTWHTTVVDVRPLDVLGYGPVLLDLLPRAPAVEPGERLAPWGLLQVDARRRRLRVWTDLPVYRLVPDTEARWPGWTVRAMQRAEAARRTRHPDRFFPTAEEAARAMDDMHARLDEPTNERFRRALRFAEAAEHSRQRPLWRRLLHR